VRVKLVIGGKM